VFVEFLVILAVLVFVAWLVTGPLRRPAAEEDERERAERADLEAAREAKYREIRDAELDFKTGKLSDEDFRALDRTLRGEAIEILRRLDEVEGKR
jgi:flagellar biosynthesis/type III secretory pathway M-ring protein FliF/YscJ